MQLFAQSEAVESKLVKMETNRTAILPPWISLPSQKESLACQITSPFSNKLGCLSKLNKKD